MPGTNTFGIDLAEELKTPPPIGGTTPATEVNTDKLVETVKAHGTVSSGTEDFDLDNGSYHTVTVGGDFTITFSNWSAANDVVSITIQLINAGAHTLTVTAYDNSGHSASASTVFTTTRFHLNFLANENLLNALLPEADDFDRALQSVDEAKEIKAVKEGLDLIYGKFNGFLAQQGIKEIEAANKAFDTDLHEAITKIPAPSKKLKGKVVDVVQKGYFLNEKVLRFAKVVIGE